MTRITLATMAILLTACLSGCATGAGGVSDEEAIEAVAAQWSAALIAHDLDAVMALYSEDFADNDGNEKEAVRAFLADTIDQGMLENLDIARETAVLEIDGDTATYSGIGLSSDLGSVGVDLTFGREAEGWKITSMFAG